jgi:protein-S-isoprenylcysteine O-methyltransferase Ste14
MQDFIDTCRFSIEIWVIYWIILSWNVKSEVLHLRGWKIRFIGFVIFLGFVITLFPNNFLIRHKIFILPLVMSFQWIGLLLGWIGLGWTVWARHTLGKNWSGRVTLKQNHELIQRGPYAWVRHPIYAGLLLFLFGTVLITGQLFSLIGLILSATGYWLKLQMEEELLKKAFPEEYVNYAHRVKRIFPGIF